MPFARGASVAILPTMEAQMKYRIEILRSVAGYWKNTVFRDKYNPSGWTFLRGQFISYDQVVWC